MLLGVGGGFKVLELRISGFGGLSLLGVQGFCFAGLGELELIVCSVGGGGGGWGFGVLEFWGVTVSRRA